MAFEASSRMFDKIKAAPRSDWSIENIRTACRQLGMTCEAPTRGSHYKVSSPYVSGHLTVPFRRPIKPVYIRSLIGLFEAHIIASRDAEKGND